jgi:hypothetical protein
VVDSVVPLLIRWRKLVREERQRKRRERGGNRRRGVHRRRRIRPEMLAEAADSGELLRCLGGVSGMGGKRGKERGPRAFYWRRQGRPINAR